MGERGECYLRRKGFKVWFKGLLRMYGSSLEDGFTLLQSDSRYIIRCTIVEWGIWSGLRRRRRRMMMMMRVNMC